jgi:hypothetical protein
MGAANAVLLRERTPSAPRMPLLLAVVFTAAALMLPLRCTRGSTRCSSSGAEAVADARAASASWLGKHLRASVCNAVHERMKYSTAAHLLLVDTSVCNMSAPAVAL